MIIKIYCNTVDYKIIKKYSKFNLVKGFFQDGKKSKFKI